MHIAGTNGKGSTLAMLDAMLQSDGRRVQRYISPHLVHFNERFLFDGQPIAEPELAEVLEHCERINLGLPITEFEITTAAAFLAFARRPADALLIETGLGGRLDATNVIARPRLTALAPISLDHQSFLGEHLAQIAFEKAGILKPERAVHRRAAASRGAGGDRGARGRDRRTLAGPWPRLAGAPRSRPAAGRERRAHARSAAARARRRASDRQCRARGDLCAGASRPGAGPDAIAAGLRSASWPARLQRLARGPLVDLLPAGSALWLDGGHNPAAAQALAESLKDRPIRGPGTWSSAC